MPIHPGPYEIGAPDGNSYFAVLGPQPRLLNGYRMLLQARQIALRMPAGEGRARALAIDVVLRDVQRSVDRVSVETAQVAEREIVNLIDQRQLRPNPPGKSAGRRLRDAIQCRAIPTRPAGGAVGIGDLSVLNQVADADGQAYWRAQEFGSRHMVGRTIRGAFQPGGAFPNKYDFRTHPVFQVGSHVALISKPAPMHIENPIPEKRFLREGAYQAGIFRARGFRAVEGRAVAELRLIQSGNHPRLRAARSFVRGRRLP